MARSPWPPLPTQVERRLLLVRLRFAGLRDRMWQRSYFGRNRYPWSGHGLAERRPWLRWRSVAAPREERAMVHDLLASRWGRFVSDPRRLGCSDDFGVEIAAAIGRSLFDLDGNPVRVGECILANAGHLPRNFHIRFVSLDEELVVEFSSPFAIIAAIGRSLCLSAVFFRSSNAACILESLAASGVRHRVPGRPDTAPVELPPEFRRENLFE
jgi:hypothetical protein